MSLTLKQELDNASIGCAAIGERVGKPANIVGRMFKDNESEMDADFVKVCREMLNEKNTIGIADGFTVKVMNEELAPEVTTNSLKVHLRAIADENGTEAKRIIMYKPMSNMRHEYTILTGVIWDSIIPKDESVIPVVKFITVPEKSGIDYNPYCFKWKNTGEIAFTVSPKVDWDTTVIKADKSIAEIIFVEPPLITELLKKVNS
jgi:hypothetical protein